MSKNPDKNIIIQRLKQYYGLSTNVALADKLGVAQNTISGWIKRNSIDYDLIFSKCEDVDFNWLLSGATTIHKQYRSVLDTEADKRLSENTKSKRIVPVSQYLKEDEAEDHLLNYCHRRFGLEKFYDDEVYINIDEICSIVQGYNLKKLFSEQYDKFKITRDEKALFHAFNELYAKCFEFYLLLTSHTEEIIDIFESLIDYVGEKEFKAILDRCEEEDMRRSNDNTTGSTY